MEENNKTNNESRKWLYDKFVAKGINVGKDYDEFDSLLTNNNESRKWAYDKACSLGYNVGKDYDEFNSIIGADITNPTESISTESETEQTEQPVSTKPADPVEHVKQDSLSVAVDETAHDKYVKGIEDSIEKKANELIEEDVNLSTFNKTKDNGLQFNPSTGKLERSYSTPYGNTTTDRHLADMESSQYASNMTVSGQLRQANIKLEQLKNKAEQRRQQIVQDWEDKYQEDYKKAKDEGKALIWHLGNTLGQEQHSYITRTNEELLTDQEYRAYQAAIRQTEEQIALLEREGDRQSGKRVGFWRGFGEITGDLRTWDFGMQDILDVTAMVNVDKKYASESVNQANQELLEATFKNQQAQQSYGQNDNFWFRAGTMTGHMPAFMIDFAVTGGGFDGINALSKVATKGATKVIGKEVIEEMTKQGFKNYVKANGVKGFSQYAGNWTIKALGTMADDLIIRAPLMTNTVQAAKTASDIIDRKLGRVVVNEDGTYDFSNDKTWSNAIWQGEANAIIENYSEMFGAHLAPITLKNMSDVAAVFGAKRLSGVLAKADASAIGAIMGKTNEMFTKLGVSDYFGEVTEEYYGQLWRTMLNLDDAYRQNPDGSRTNLLATGQFHGDILGGMALSMGLMGAGKYSLSAANYTMMKHDVNKADSRARELFGNDIWEPLRQTIDLTTNDDIGNYIVSVLIDDKLTLEEKEAVLNYVERSLYLRGFNLATLAQSRNADETDSDIIAQQNNESFLDGYNASTPQEMNDANNNYLYHRENMVRTFGLTDESDIDAFLGDNPIETVARRRQAGASTEETQTIIDYINAKATYDGMLQSVRDDIDGRIEQSNARIDSYVNRSTGNIHGAVLKQDDRLVYIVNGNAVAFDDGVIDTRNSSNTIIVKDAETGELKQISPSDLLTLYDVQDPNEQKEISAQQIRNGVADESLNKINGVVDFNDKAQFLNEAANQIAITMILAQRGLDADYIKTFLGNAQIVENPDGTLTFTDGQNEVVVPKQEIQQQVDANNMQRVADFNNQVNGTRKNIDNTSSTEEKVSQTPQSSLIPKDESGNPIYEQADSETAWDALMEDAEGDEIMAGEVAKSMIADKEAELKKLEKTKIKEGKTPAEKMAALKERKAEVEKIKQDIEAWKKIAAVPMQRHIAQQERIRQEEAEAAAKRKADEERLLAERLEAERKEQELLNGIPDYSEDTPQNARARGYRRVNGHIEERQQPIEAVQGKETEVEFSNDVRPKGHYAVIDAAQLQPSHIQGNRNPLHFLDEAQPKERNDKASIVSAQKIAGNIRPATITTGETAYVGTPTVNTRGEVIQGNSRSDALRLMWNDHQEQGQKYKQYLINNAEQFGLNPEDVSNMESPVLVRMLDVSDEQAITLGQYVAQDTESGGVERIKPKNAVKKMGDDINSFANMLLDSADEDTSFAELLDQNGVKVLKWMAQKGYITDTQYSSAFDTKGSLTAEAKNDLRGIMYQSIFEGGNTRLEEMFNALPAKAQKAILATAHRDFNSPNSERMIEEIQNSIRAFYALMQDEQFAKAKNFKDATKAVEAWQKQYQMDDVTGEGYLPSEKFSNFALHLAKMYKGEKQSNIQGVFAELYDLIQGTKEDNLFEQADKTPRTLVQAIKEVLNIDYNGQRRNNVLGGDNKTSQQGQHGRTGNVASRERTESGEQSANDSGRTDEDSGSSAFETNRQTENESGDIRTAQTVHQSRSEREGLEQDLDGRRQTDGTGMADDAAGIMETRNDRSDIRVFEEGLDASYNEYSEHSERTRRAAESERLVSLAKLHGMFVPAEVIKTLTGKHPKRTGESFVYIDKEAGKVTKVKDPYAKAAIKSGVQPEDAAFEYLVHNLIFPETAYTFEGISEDMGDVRIVLSQSFIQSKGHPTKEQIAEALAERGLFPEDKYSFGNEFVSVTDVEGDNVLLGEDGTVYFIDPIIRFKKPLKEILDNYNRNNNSTLGEQIKSAEKEVNTSPTDKQKEAGNYKKGHVQIGTFNITIEQPKGSVRSGVDTNGRKWETTMHNTYGYIRGTEGVDGDHIDVFLSDDIDGWNGNNVFVVDQYNEDGTFDEHKVMLGFNTIEEAESAYLDNYEKGWEKKHKIVVSPIHTEKFEKWIDSSHRKTKAFAEYKSVQSAEKEDRFSPIQGYSYDEIIETVSDEIKDILNDSGIEGVDVKEVWAHGSRMRGDAKDDSDLDIVLFYEGDAREDGLFNAISESGLVIEGIKIDVNPIRVESQKDIDRYKEKSRQYDKEKMSKNAEKEGVKDPYYVEESLDNGDKRITHYNSRGEISTITTERNGNVISVDSYNEGILFEHTEYDGNGKATFVTRYDKQGKPVSTQQYVDGKIKTNSTETVSVSEKSDKKTIVEQSKKHSSKIEDFGEKIGGARKDVIRKYADKINVNGTTFGSMFPKPDIDKLIEAGLPIDRVAALKSVYDNAKHEFERSKKHRGKERALRETVFYAVFAKGILSGNEDFELHHEGLVFTEVGVKLVKANIALYQAVFDRLGVEYIKTDLSAYAITPLTEETKKKLNLKSLNEHNGKMQESLAKRKGTEPPVYKDGDLINFIGEKYYNPKDQFETLEEAIDTMVERIGKEVKVGEEIKHTPILYWNVDALGRKDYSKIFIGIKVHGHGIVKLMEFKSSNEANSWIDEHDADFQQMAAAKIEQLKSDKSKPLPKYRIDNIYVRDNSGSIVRYDVYADFGKGIMRPLKSFDIPAKETSQERLRAQSEVYKNEVLPYMNSEEAKQSADEHARRIQQEKESKNRNYTTERKSRERVGRDWRNGKDATPDMFVDMDGNKSVFGFRAVEFGNYVTNKERQQFLNDIYDALMDMSDVLGVSPRALSLGGQLAIAVGARGKSSASGHYEPEKNVINLTKTSGYGILAHEWLHAFDRYFSNYNPSAIYVGGVQYATSEEYKDDMRQEVKDAFAALMDVIKKSDYYKRSMMLGEYWSSDKELAARALQDHIIRKLNERGQKNEFLSNLTATEDWDGEAENYPFPLGEESERIGEAIDNLFSVIDEKVDEKGNTVMYQKGELVMDAESEAFRRATERTMKQLESIGIDVEIVSDEQTETMLGNDVKFMSERRFSMLKKAASTINRWLSDNVRGKSFELHLPEHTRKLIKKAMGRDFDSHNITSNGIAHALKNHGETGTKLNERSIPIRKEDAELIPYIMTAPDRVEKAATDISGRESIRFYKELSNGYVVVVEKEYKNSPDDMETITMWAEKSSKATNAQQNAAPDTHVQNAILSTDVAKIQKDAESAILNDEKINFSRSAGIFYSNAKKAVLDIKQDKATPEQWLKMIEKNGGLKASEDRWLGLSDWLKTQQKRKNIDVQYAKEYDGEAKQIAHGIKDGDISSIDLAAIEMVKLVKDGDILIPIPSRTGKATTSLALANRIAELAGKGKVADVLTGKERESLYNIKKEGKELPKASELEFVLKNQDVLNGNNRVVFVDNVMGTGTTLEAAVELIPNATALVYAKDNSTLSDKKTLTKDEILNFINENSIQKKEDVMKGQPMFHKGQMSFDFLNQQDTPLSDTRLRKLEEGETSKIERIFTENKNFDFTSGEKIESIDDVAFIFKQLEDESIENSFAVLVKDGKPTVIHLGMGSYTATGLNGSALNVAVERIQPDKIYFIHNHPSGNLTASRQDIELLNRLKSTYGDIFEDGIIINLRSGKFATFNAEEKNIHDEKNIDNAVPVKVYSFNKQVFEKNYDPAETFKIRSSSDVAKFISSHRLGERPKLGILVCNNQLGVVGNVFTPYTKVTKENAKDIAKDIVYYTTSMGGTCAMMFGNANIYEVGSKRISQHVEDISTGSIKLMDYLNMQKDGSYWSASDEGVSFMRTSSGTIYGWTVDGKVYLTKDGINPNTPVHEYSHLWAAAMANSRPKRWNRIVEGLKGSHVWNEVLLDSEYKDIHGNDNLMASEVLSRLSGTENYRRTMEEAQREIESEKGIFAKAEKVTIWERVKQALKDFWNWVGLRFTRKPIAPEQSTELVLADFWNGIRPDVNDNPMQRMFVGEKGAANIDKAEEATARLDNLSVARKMEAEGKDAKNIKLATGWERGSDGKWRYEVMDNFRFDKSGNVDFEKRNPEYRRYKELIRKNNSLAFEGKELSAEESAEFDKLSATWKGTKLHNSRRLKDYIDAPELFEAYPELKDVDVKFAVLEDGVQGKYNHKQKTVTLNAMLGKEAAASTLNHEIQHAIQHIEGFAKGGNSNDVITRKQEFKSEVRNLHEMMLDTPKWSEYVRLVDRWIDNEDASVEARIEAISNSGVLDGIRSEQDRLRRKYGNNTIVGRILNGPYAEDADIWNELPESFNDRFDAYQRLAGEVESRNVQRRMEMNEEERRSSLAQETEDVARKDQVFLYDALENAEGNTFVESVPFVNAEDVESDWDIRFSMPDNKYTEKQKKYYVEKISGGLWIDNKQEFAKFVSAVENYVFEENGEGIAYTDNHFYAYYWNVNGEPIPYVDVYLNAEESQDVIKKIQKQNEKRRAHIGIRGYIDRAIVRAGSSNGKDNGNHGNNTSIPHRAGNDKLGGNILRKGRYFDNPSLYVKTQRADRYNRDGISSTVSSTPTPAQRRQMVEHAENLAKRLHLDNIEIVNSVSGLEGKKKSAKGFYDPKTGKITIVIPNNTSIADIEKTLLHETVAHYGLRQLFGEHFDTFLDNVYNNADENIRKRIAELAIRKYNYDFRKATEEYLASLAESTNFENAQQSSWWQKVKDFFADMLSKLGFKDFRGVTLTDNELRYILWRSYENLKEKKNDNIFSQASDIAKQYELGVGDYAKSSESEDDVLFRDGDDYEKALAREQYERRLRTGWYQTQEALQDSMLGLKEAMSAILEDDVNIEDVEGFENAYLGENRLSSVNKAEADAFAHILFKPMLDEVAKLSHNSEERETLTDYMMAKHGLERNEYMRQQAMQNGEDANRDFAGLTSLTGFDDITAAEAEAKRMVDEYEQDHDTTELWDKVNAVSNAILSKSYECGLIDKDTFENISNMYEFYIPLRGFEEKTSEEAYAYLTHSHSVFNAPIKKSQGRSSKADDPFSNLQSMAESAIMQGNRNRLVKQRFLNFVLNHPSDLVSVSEIWLEYDNVDDEWRPVFPDNLNDNDTPEEIERKFQEFEKKMQSLSEQYPDKYKHGKDAANIPYRIVESRDMRQHQVVVKRGGRDIILTINGNPRAAQALNGQTNPDNDMSGAIGAILRSGEWVNRQLSAFYTTRNPDFIVSNFLRDMFYSNTMAWVKESPNYALRFHKNYMMANPITMKRLLNKYRKGTLDTSDKIEGMFYQFMINGGETGYANVRDIEQHKNDIRKELRKSNGKLKIGRALSLLAERFDELNRAVENCARFAAFVTSREMGRTVDRSVYDAKEISVNFNKKGSGAKFYGSVGQTFSGNASALASGLGRSGFVFWNAAIQGTTNFGRQIKRHPAKAFTGIASMFLLGALVAFLGGDDDDDDNKNSYYNLPEYVRRSNILFRAGEHWISIPLPVEYRAIYGLGELMTSTISGKEHLTDSEIAEAIIGQMSQVLPLDFMEGGGGLNAFVPSAVKPLWEAYVIEKGWTGMPIYKDTPYNKNMPEWTKAYSSANKHIVNLAASLNEATGGDRYTKGSIDINPAKIEYMLNGYFGGVFSTINKLSKTAETISGSREYDPRNILLLNRVVKAGDERTEYRTINNEYFRLKEEHDQLKMRLGKYENDTYNGIFDYAEKIDFLYNSPEYQRYEIFEFYNKEIKSLNDMIKNTYDNDERKELESYLNELKKEMIEEINKTRQTRKGA